MCGKASSIRNIDKLFTSITESSANVYHPGYLCLNNPSYVQTIGLIKLNYKKLLESQRVSSEEAASLDMAESKFDRFILDENELN